MYALLKMLCLYLDTLIIMFVLIMIFSQKVNTENKYVNIQIFAITGIWIRYLSQPGLECYLSATETTERVYWIQAI